MNQRLLRQNSTRTQKRLSEGSEDILKRTKVQSIDYVMNSKRLKITKRL